MKFLKGFMMSLVVMLGFSVFAGQSLAAESEEMPQELSKAQLEELNKVLDDLTNEVNEKLAKGETSVTAEGYVSFQDEPFVLTFDTNTKVEGARAPYAISPYALRTGSYSGTLKNTAGFNFSHRLHGSWSYNTSNSKIDKDSVSFDSQLTGTWYSKSHDTKWSRLTDSVYNVYSSGQFGALKVGATYDTYFHVRINGTGTYTVVKTSIG